VIVDPWWPWYGYGWGYYPYASYYYDPYYNYGYGYDPVYQPEPVQAEYGDTNGYGNGDSSVSEVQAALAQKGYYHGTVDGRLGPETNSAVRQYQRNHGMEVTGSINQAVIDSLRRR
jgi:peptidoglycan hydrolase-like protein with peptidoglycan-binding domain